MKHLIPIGLAFSGAYLIGLPLIQQVSVSNAMIASQVLNNSVASFASLRATPYVHFLIPWIAGFILIFFAIRLAFRSYRE